MKLKSGLVEADKPILVISGATASGKSSLSLDIASELNAEIISADSAQVYKYFDIGTDKPSVADRSQIVHHCIDIFEPDVQCTAADWIKVAFVAIEQIQAKGKLPIIVGGTTLYISLLINGLSVLPKRDEKLRGELELLSSAELYKKLEILVPEKASKLHVNDRVRVIRAIEVELTQVKQGEDAQVPVSNNQYPALKNVLIILLGKERSDLYQKINSRVKSMFERGLLEEAKILFEKFGENIPAFKTLGYEQCAQYFNANCKLEDLEGAISQASRRYAKRQMTFWRNEPKKKSWMLNDFNYSLNELRQIEYVNVIRKELCKDRQMAEVLILKR